MANKKSLLEYYGTQRPTFAGNAGAGSNFSIGKHLGHSGADTNFSSYSSNKKFPIDYFEEEEDTEEDTQLVTDEESLERYRQHLAEAYRKTEEESLNEKSLLIFILEDTSENVVPRLRGQGDPEGYASGIFEDADEDSDEEIDEQAMAGGVPGVGMKLGHNPDGTPTSKSQLKKLRSKQDIYNIAESQRWNHKTLGRIKYK